MTELRQLAWPACLKILPVWHQIFSQHGMLSMAMTLHHEEVASEALYKQVLACMHW